MANLTQDSIWQHILKLGDEQAKTVQNRRLPVSRKLGRMVQFFICYFLWTFFKISLDLLWCSTALYTKHGCSIFFFSVACYSLIGQSLKSRRLVFNRLVSARLWKLPMYPTPNPTICLKLEVGVNVGLWDG